MTTLDVISYANILDIQANIAQAQIETLGMMAENMQRQHLGESKKYLDAMVAMGKIPDGGKP